MDALTPNPAPRARTLTAPGTRRIRAVAKINGSDETRNGAVSVAKPNGEESRRVTLSFGDQSASHYELDFCYEQHQGNSVVFEREVRPLVSLVLDGCNATVIATGANGDGKSHLIQGDTEEPGLVTLAVSEMVQMAESNGKAVFVSLYEATSDRVFDLLNPARQEVIIRGDAQGNIQLKGLSQVAVTSVPMIQKLLDDAVCKSKPNQKIANEPPRSNHVGLILYALNPNQSLIGKMNFVELAGYEDLRRKSLDGSTVCEITKINRSIYAVHNVLHSLSANEAHVPYRENKLTHMLQDSLGGTSRVLIITCLNQSICQDFIRMVSLASRSCQNSIKEGPSSMKKPSSVVSSSQNSFKGAPSSMKTPSNIPRSAFGRGIGSASTTSKKQIISGIQSSKKAMNVSCASKPRKLFGEANRCNSEKISSQTRSLDIIPATETLFEEQVSSLASSLDIIPVTESSFNEPGKLCSGAVTDEVALEDEHPLLKSLKDVDPLPGMDAFLLTSAKSAESTPLSKIVVLHNGENLTGVTPTESSRIKEDNNIEKKNNGDLLYPGGSPPISTRLQEISNNLKMLYNSTPSYAESATKIDFALTNEVSTDFVEPRTPTRPHDNIEIVSFLSPRQVFSARTDRAKDSLVQGYLNILNTASKEDLKKLKGIGDKRATSIVEMREKSPEPFKQLDDLKNIGLSGKQIKKMVKSEMAELFG